LNDPFSPAGNSRAFFVETSLSHQGSRSTKKITILTPNGEAERCREKAARETKFIGFKTILTVPFLVALASWWLVLVPGVLSDLSLSASLR